MNPSADPPLIHMNRILEKFTVIYIGIPCHVLMTMYIYKFPLLDCVGQ